jgi:hypothetical protein
MRNYKIAAQVRHSGKHLETEVAAYDLHHALLMFAGFLLDEHLSMEALSELDVSEVVQ